MQPTTYTDADKLKDLLKIAAEMRTAQKVYFRNRTAENLDNARLLERKMDAPVAELSKVEKAEQGKLF